MISAPVDRDALWRTFDAKAEAQEPPYVRAALQQFAFEAAQIATILGRMDDGDPFVVEAVRRILTRYEPGAEYHAQWLGRYVRLISETVQVGGETLAGRVGFRFDLSNPRVQRIIRERAWAGANNITDTTKASIKVAVESGRAEGLGVRQIAKRIHETTFGEITQTRATTIARTETVGALNAGEHESARQSGVMRSKEWMHQLVGKSRPNHKALNGTRIDMGAAFSMGDGRSMHYPHDPAGGAKNIVNCRCGMLYYDEEAPV